jgi:hypothetical protein
MILIEFLEQIRHTKIIGRANGVPIDNIELCFGSKYDSSNQRFDIQSYDGGKIEKHSFKKIEDITNNLLLAKLIKFDIILGIQNNGYDYTKLEFVVSI